MIVTLCLISGATCGYWWRGRTTPGELPSLRGVVARCQPAVVGVRCLLHPEHRASVREGSGFFIHPDGLIATNAHLVAGRMLVVVEVQGRGRFTAEVVGEDELSDVAVLRIRGAGRPFPALAFGDSDEVAAGDWVVSIGRPLSLGHTVTAGLVSSAQRHLPIDDANITARSLQFSAAVNPGCSGSPVLDLAGRVVGMTIGKAHAGEGLAFAVPSKVLQWVLDRMERHDGKVPRGYLGVSLAPGSAEGGGARVTRVEPGGPAWRAGVRDGDILVRFAGEPVVDAESLYDRIMQTLPATEVAVEVCAPPRAGPRALVAVLGAVPVPEAAGERDPAPDRPERAGAMH